MGQETENLWWGYKHASGGCQAKRYFDKEDLEEAEQSSFVDQIVYPFPAIDRDEAIDHIKAITQCK